MASLLSSDDETGILISILWLARQCSTKGLEKTNSALIQAAYQVAQDCALNTALHRDLNTVIKLDRLSADIDPQIAVRVIETVEEITTRLKKTNAERQ